MTTTTMAELPSLKGQELGTSPWIEVTQDRVNTCLLYTSPSPRD